MAETAVTEPSVAGDEPAARLARVWLTALAVAEGEQPANRDGMPMDAVSAQEFLSDQSAALLEILLGDPFRPRRAAAVGHALVCADFVSSDFLGRSLRVLILRLPSLLIQDRLTQPLAVRGLERRVAEVTEALANGYVRALRDRTLAEQESIRCAELDAQRIISDQLRHQATHDPLTGLPNRAAVFDRLTAALHRGPGVSAGLCYLDLDGFKAVNDQYGHAAGDELLVTVARRIGEVARARGAIAGRIGGDEFVVVTEISPGIGGLVTLAAGILEAVRRPIPLRVGWVRVSACAGIAERAAGSPPSATAAGSPPSATAAGSPPPATVLADADAALYWAKSRGPGNWAVYGGGRTDVPGG